MSSILDALNKLEQEKAAAQVVVTEIDPALAAQELLGQDILRDRVAVHIRPASLIAAVAVFLFVVIGLSVWISLALRPTPATQPATPTVSGAIAVETAVVVQREAEPTHESETELAVPEFTNVGAVLPVSEPGEAVSPDPVSASDASDPVIEIAPSVTPPVETARAPVVEFANLAAAAPVRESVTPAVTTDSPKPSDTVAAEATPGTSADTSPKLPENAHSLPVLSSAIRARYGLGDIKLNMVWPADLSGSYGRPYDLALINRMKVQVGDTVPSTKVRLVKVERDGVAVQIVGTSKYFFIPL